MGRLNSRLGTIIIAVALVLILLLAFLAVGVLKDRQDPNPALSSLPRFQQSDSTNLASEKIWLIENEGYKNIYLDTSNCLPSVDWRLLVRLAPQRNAALALGSPDASNICKFALAHYWGDWQDQEDNLWSAVSLYKMDEKSFALSLAIKKGYVLKSSLEARQVKCWLWAVGEKQLEKYCESPPLPSQDLLNTFGKSVLVVQTAVETSSVSTPTATQPPAVFANIDVPPTPVPTSTSLPTLLPLPSTTPVPSPVPDWNFEVVVNLGGWSNLQRHLDISVVSTLPGGVFPVGFNVQYPQGVLVPAGSIVQITAQVSYQGTEYQVGTKTRSLDLIEVGSPIDYKPAFWTRQKVYWVTSGNGANIRVKPHLCRIVRVDATGNVYQEECQEDKWVVATFDYHELVTIYADGVRSETVGANGLWWPVDLGGAIYYVHDSVVAPYQPLKPQPAPTRVPVWPSPTRFPSVTPLATVTPLIPITLTPTPVPSPEASRTWAPPTIGPTTTPEATLTLIPPPSSTPTLPPDITATIAFMQTQRAPTSTPVPSSTPGEVPVTQTPVIESSPSQTNQTRKD